ncbi:MAG: acetylornithine deacetylase [Deltaproteobacteria bacterium]|nr:acetylornithine deacetylase [Deltaproteobacteria bacterium]
MSNKYLYDITSQLIGADTVSHHASAPAMQMLADHLDTLGFSVHLQTWEEGRKANLIARVGPEREGGLVLSGHVDIVPFEGQPGWSREPLALGDEGERLYGRGTTDMKGFLAQCLAAAKQLDLGALERPLVLLFTSDEEVGCQGGARLADALPELLGQCPAPRLAWIGEPTSWKVFHAHKGVAGFLVEVRGEGGHSSRPEEGVNAIAVAGKALALIGELQEALRREGGSAEMQSLFPDAPYATFNFGTIEGGTAANMIAEACRFTVSYRALPDQDPVAIHQRVKEALAELDPHDWGSPSRRAEIVVSEPFIAPGVLSARGTPLEKALFAELGTSEAGGAPFCTDAGHFARAGMECIICGPGDLDEAHQPDESISRAAFEAGPDHIATVVRRLLEGPQH